MYQDVAVYHKASQTMLIWDATFTATSTPPKILTEEEEYVCALLFYAHDTKDKDI